MKSYPHLQSPERESSARGKSAWPCFHYDQENLEFLSRDLFVTDQEWHPTNHLYGSAELLRQYAGLPDAIPVPWAIQAIQNFLTSEDCHPPGKKALSSAGKLTGATVPRIFVFNEVLGNLLRSNSSIEVEEIGNTFLYARELHQIKWNGEPTLERRGTIAMPDKSDINKTLDFDRHAYASRLAALPEEYQPVYVSMHWRDFDRGCHAPYLEAGLQVVCAGHSSDPLFHLRLYDVLRHFKYSCSNEISTSFILSVLSGCRFFYLDGGEVSIQYHNQPSTYIGQEPELESPGQKLCIEASPFPPEATPNSRQLELAAFFAGASHFKPPGFFRDRWECDRLQLRSQLVAEDLVFPAADTPLRKATWLLHGVDNDGWTNHVFGFEVHAMDDLTAIRIHLDLPQWHVTKDLQPLQLKIEQAGQEPLLSRHPLTAGRNSLLVPLPPPPTSARVVIVGPDARPLPQESRVRSLRLEALRWEGSATEAPKPGHAENNKKVPASWWKKFLDFYKK